MRSSLILVMISIFFFATHVGAQPIGPSYLDINPKTPSSNQTVTATFESYSYDFNTSVISWFVNGSLIKQETGLKTFSFKTGNTGENTSIRAVAKTQDGFIVENSLTINPTEIELFVEAETYTPPFYKGKSLHTHQSTVRVSAIPTFITSGGTKINPSNLVYRWKKDGVVLQDQSGFGKQTVQIVGGIIVRPFQIEVEVSSVDGNIKGQARNTLTSSEAKLLIYEESPLYGIRFNKALQGNFELGQDEITLTAVPYFFSINSVLGTKYSWRMNSQIVGDIGPSITFRNETEESGFSRVSVKSENTSKILQFASSALTVNFGKETEDSTFFRQQ